MSRSVNKVILLGHLGKDAETKFTQSGVACTTFSLATNRRWKPADSQEWKEETDWHNIVLWRSEKLTEYLTKGKQIYVEGRLQTRSYEDKEGVKRYITEVIAAEVVLTAGSTGSRAPIPEEAPPPRGRSEQPGSASPASASSDGVITDDDVPF